MPKKTKRKVSAVVTPSPAPEVMRVSAGEATAAASSSPRTFNRRAATAPAEFNPDYSYIVKDLKRIGILAGTFFVILVALSFIMPLILH
jgi:hypothetical protein